jgi:hypothetical protein
MVSFYLYRIGPASYRSVNEGLMFKMGTHFCFLFSIGLGVDRPCVFASAKSLVIIVLRVMGECGLIGRISHTSSTSLTFPGLLEPQ